MTAMNNGLYYDPNMRNGFTAFMEVSLVFSEHKCSH